MRAAKVLCFIGVLSVVFYVGAKVGAKPIPAPSFFKINSVISKNPAVFATLDQALVVDGSGGTNWGTITATGNAGGDLTGTYPNPTIAAGTVTASKLAPGVIPKLKAPTVQT